MPASEGPFTLHVSPVTQVRDGNLAPAANLAPTAPLPLNEPDTDVAVRSRPRVDSPDSAAAFVLRLTLLCVLAIGVRAWMVAQPRIGHDQDQRLFARWTRSLTEHGLSGFYEVEGFCDYPPLMLLLFRGLGPAVDAIVGAEASDLQLRMGVKALGCLGDLLIGLLLLIEARRLLGARAALLAAGLYLLNPVAIYNAAFWGQLDSIYSALLLAGLVLVGRKHWTLTGAASAAALAAKFQAIAVLPLLVFEAYRMAGFRGVMKQAGGALLGAAVIAAPLAATGTLPEAVQRSYVRVVGQYQEMSKNAYNLWYLVGDPEAADTTTPEPLVRSVAAGRAVVDVGESWLLGVTWRQVSLVLFALSIAIVLTLYSLRPGSIGRFGAAGCLALCFYLFPTEMHERYAFPAIALLALWAAARVANERVFWALTIVLLLNLAAVLSAEPIAPQIAAANLVVFGVLVAGLLVTRTREAGGSSPDSERPAAEGDEQPAGRPARPLIRVFRGVTVLAVVGAAAGGAWVWAADRSAAQVDVPRDGIWLSSLAPQRATQGWRSLARDRAAEGGYLRLGEYVYLRGLGTHAPARIVYEIPPGYDYFETVAGLDALNGGGGSVIVRLLLDEEVAFESGVLTGESEPIAFRVALGEAKTLTLVLDATDDGQRSDHFNFGLARLERAASESDLQH